MRNMFSSILIARFVFDDFHILHEVLGARFFASLVLLNFIMNFFCLPCVEDDEVCFLFITIGDFPTRCCEF